MRNLPAWIPNLNSWMSAVLLAAIVSIATALTIQLGTILSQLLLYFSWFIQLLSALLRVLPDFIVRFIFSIFQAVLGVVSYIFTTLITISTPLLLLVPIVVIAFSHHYLHFFLDRFFPDIRLPEMEKVTGFFPNIISWWEVFYGLLVIIVALLLSDIVLSFLPFLAFNSDIPNIEPSNVGRLFFWFYIAFFLFFQPLYFPSARLFIWIIAAAYLYQFESIVRQHLISVGSRLGNINSNNQ